MTSSLRKVSNGLVDIGIGQFAMSYSRLLKMDFLPPMYRFSMLIRCALPKEIVYYDTLFIPMDRYAWSFTVVSIAAVAAAFISFDKLYDGKKGSSSYKGAGRWNTYEFSHRHCLQPTEHVSDLVIAFVTTVDENIPNGYLTSPGFRSKHALVGLWMLCGFFLSMAYKSCLLTSLITIRYEKPINTVHDLLERNRIIRTQYVL